MPNYRLFLYLDLRILTSTKFSTFRSYVLVVNLVEENNCSYLAEYLQVRVRVSVYMKFNIPEGRNTDLL